MHVSPGHPEIKPMLKLKTLSERKLLYSDKMSEILRQLVLAGVAASWLFLYNDKKGSFSSEWIYPLAFFLLAITLDLLQYVRATFIFDSEYHKILDTHTVSELQDESKTYPVSDKVYKVSNRYFKAKIITSLLAFAVLIAMIAFKVATTKN